MARGITYEWKTSRYRVNGSDGMRVRFDVTFAQDMSTKVFAYRGLPLSPETGSTAGTFSHVSSPVDLEEYPEDEPIPGQSPQWFRLDYVDILVRSRAEADNFIAQVRADLAKLKESLDILDTLIVGGDETLGEGAAASSSSSSAESASSGASESLGPVQSLASYGSAAQNLLTEHGLTWTNVGTGAGSPAGIDDPGPANYATVHLTARQSTALLLIQGFDFSALPADAAVVGILAKVWLRNALAGSASADSASAEACPAPVAEDPGSIYPVLSYLAVHQPDVAGPITNLAADMLLDSDVLDPLSFGDDEALWGVPVWTPAQIQQGDFGVSLVVTLGPIGQPATIEVDGAEITVYYR